MGISLKIQIALPFLIYSNPNNLFSFDLCPLFLGFLGKIFGEQKRVVGEDLD
jgi:hypothetical protein